MRDFLLGHEPAIRLTFFFGVFAVMAAAELFMPRRLLTISKTTRWVSNLGVVAVNTIVLRLLFPAAAVGMALHAEERGWGLLNNLPTPRWLDALIAVALLDMAIYLQHALFHAVPAFWRLHRMHHADLDYDVTTGARFHPIEIVLSMVIKYGVVAALGAPPEGVLLFEILLNATAMFNHSNVALPLEWDASLRRAIVTPDMHRVHHSSVEHEANSNFGFNLSVWDRLFGTYEAQPAAGHEMMEIGLTTFREPAWSRLDRMLWIPFAAGVEGYAINRRTFGGGTKGDDA